MDFKIQNEKEMRLLKRKDYTARVFHDGPTPSRDKIVDALAKQLRAKRELLVVRKIGAEFGSPSSVVEASVYADEESLGRFEPEYMRKRHGKEAPKDGAASEGDS